MNKDHERFDRSASPTVVSMKEASDIIQDQFQEKVVELRLLSGGFANTNYFLRLENHKKPYVLRIGDCSSLQFDIEIAVLKKLRGSIPVPGVEMLSSFKGKPVALLEYIEGQLFSSDLGEKTPTLNESGAFNIGETLARIHAIKMSSPGFFNERLKVEKPSINFGDEFVSYMLQCLDQEIALERMGKKLNGKVRKLIEENKYHLSELQNTNSLIHCDFNGKNILIRDTTVAAVLDWEFAASGSPLVDIGNFLRFEEDYSPKLVSNFTDGYLAGGGALPQDWRRVAKLLDLASMCSFITRPGGIPKTTKTAIRIFEKTLNEI